MKSYILIFLSFILVILLFNLNLEEKESNCLSRFHSTMSYYVFLSSDRNSTESEFLFLQNELYNIKKCYSGEDPEFKIIEKVLKEIENG